jgi:hypothetical protein
MRHTTDLLRNKTDGVCSSTLLCTKPEKGVLTVPQWSPMQLLSKYCQEILAGDRTVFQTFTSEAIELGVPQAVRQRRQTPNLPIARN